MRRDERRFVLGWIYVVTAIACCIAGFITLRHDQIGAGVVFMAAMYGMALYADHMREYLIGQARAELSAFTNKYRNLQELARVVQVMDEFLEPGRQRQTDAERSLSAAQ